MDHAQVGSIPEIQAKHVDEATIHEAAIGRINDEQLLKLRTLGMIERKRRAENVIIENSGASQAERKKETRREQKEAFPVCIDGDASFAHFSQKAGSNFTKIKSKIFLTLTYGDKFYC